MERIFLCHENLDEDPNEPISITRYEENRIEDRDERKKSLRTFGTIKALVVTG